MEFKNIISTKNCLDEEKKIVFIKGNYENNNRLFIGTCSLYNGEWEFDIDITRNIPADIPYDEKKYGFIDFEKLNTLCPELIKLLQEKEWFQFTNIVAPSGYNVYPLVMFSDEFLNVICNDLP